MSSLALSFNNVTFNPVSQNDGQIWLTSTELAKALGYAETDSVSKIYNRNKDEFTSHMTTTVKMGVIRKTGKVTMSVRLFSLRGCHLLAMFAKTEVAKQFRKWVLDLLDKEVGQPVTTNIADEEKISDTQAYKLKTAVEKRCKNNKEHYQTVWTALKHRFELPKYTDILVKDFDNAMNLVWTIALPEPVLEQSQPDYSQNNALWKTIGLLQYEDVSKTIVLMEALIQQGMVQIKNLKKQRSLIWDALEQQKAPILDPVIRAGLIKQAQDFIARQNALNFA